MNIPEVKQEILDKGYNAQRQEWADSMDHWLQELDLVRACLEGFPNCLAKADALRAVRKLSGGQKGKCQHPSVLDIGANSRCTSCGEEWPRRHW